MVGDSAQAIYGWRGASDVMTRFDGHALTLSQSFRFGPRLADEANRWLTMADAPIRLTGADAIPTELAPVERPDAVLCRTNIGALHGRLFRRGLFDLQSIAVGVWRHRPRGNAGGSGTDWFRGPPASGGGVGLRHYGACSGRLRPSECQPDPWPSPGFPTVRPPPADRRSGQRWRR